MKLKIKAKYKIMGKTIKIKMVKTNDNTIYLSTNQTDSEMEESFWHEMNHCMQWLSGVNQAVSRELLEIMAEMNSRITAQVIRDS